MGSSRISALSHIVQYKQESTTLKQLLLRIQNLTPSCYNKIGDCGRTVHCTYSELSNVGEHYFKTNVFFYLCLVLFRTVRGLVISRSPLERILPHTSVEHDFRMKTCFRNEWEPY
jgi:hypothetical protein